MKIMYFGQSDRGRVRKANEDSFAHEKIGKHEYLFVVADGMGGHQAGDVASRLGTLTFVDQYKALRAKKIPISESMHDALRSANGAILAKAQADPSKRGMGTTFSAMVLALANANTNAHIIHVGDSRIYLIRGDQIHRLTTDHTFVEKMMEEGRISAEEARNHPQKNILYMSLGARESFSPVEIEDSVQKEDTFVLCSDGLSNMVADELIQEYAGLYPPRQLVDKLIDLANEKGGTDNITIVAVHLGENDAMKETQPIEIRKKPGRLLFLGLTILIVVIVLFLIVLR